MTLRAYLRAHPLMNALLTALLVVFMFGEMFPRFAHEPRNWSFAILEGLLFGGMIYVLRTQSRRFIGYMLVVLGVVGLAVYAWLIVLTGVPHGWLDRMSMSMVVALPIVMLAFAARILRGAPIPR